MQGMARDDGVSQQLCSLCPQRLNQHHGQELYAPSQVSTQKKKKEHSDSQSCLDRMDSSKDSKFAGTGSENEGARRPLGKCAQKEIYTELDRRKLALTSKSEKKIQMVLEENKLEATRSQPRRRSQIMTPVHPTFHIFSSLRKGSLYPTNMSLSERAEKCLIFKKSSDAPK